MGRMMRKWMSAILVVLMLVAATAPAAMAASYSAYLNKATKIYQKASTSSRSMKVAKGTKCEVVGISDGWARVKRGSVTAFVPVKYVTMTDRIKAYANRNTKVYQKASTSSRSMNVSANTEVYIIGASGDFWKVETKNGKTTAYIKMSHTGWSKVKVNNPAPTPEPTVTPEEKTSWKDQVVMMDWFEGGSSVLDRGDYATLYHCNTGITIRVKRMGGSNHADLEPATSEDTAKLLKISGGEFDWDSEAVILYSEGKYVACAINTMPHGDQTIRDNDYDGQFCLHMVNSRTHGSDNVNNVHQKAIQKAYSWAH